MNKVCSDVTTGDNKSFQNPVYVGLRVARVTGKINQFIRSLSSWCSGINTTTDHSACWPDGLMALAGLGSNPGLEESFSARLG